MGENGPKSIDVRCLEKITLSLESLEHVPEKSSPKLKSFRCLVKTTLCLVNAEKRIHDLAQNIRKKPSLKYL